MAITLFKRLHTCPSKFLVYSSGVTTLRGRNVCKNAIRAFSFNPPTPSSATGRRLMDSKLNARVAKMVKKSFQLRLYFLSSRAFFIILFQGTIKKNSLFGGVRILVASLFARVPGICRVCRPRWREGILNNGNSLPRKPTRKRRKRSVSFALLCEISRTSTR